MIFKNINSEDITGLIICSEPPISSSAIRTKETVIDGRDGAIVEKLGYKTRVKNVEIGLKKDADINKILSYFSGEGDLTFNNESDKVYKAAIYEQVDLERLLRLRKGTVSFYCQPFKYKKNDIFETVKDNKVKEKVGQYLELTKCAEKNIVDLKLEGLTTQATRSGKNRLPYNYYDGNSKKVNGITFTVNKDKSITANGTATANASFSITNPNNYAIAAGSYKLIGENNTYTKQAIRGSYKKADGTITYIGLATSSFTIPEGATNVHIYVVILQGETVNNVTFYPMLLNSTETDLTFEAGGASPSSDYRSPIENVEGKNKFNKSNMTEATWDNGKTNTVTLLEDGRIQSTANYSQWAAKCIDIPNLKANTDYVVSGKIISSTADNAMIIVKGYKNNTLSNIIYHRYAVGTRFELSFNSSDYEKIGISLSGDNSTLDTTYTTIFDEIQLEEGTVATPYVPYNSLEIKNVGENLLDLSKCQFNNCKLGSDGKSIISNISNNYYCELLTTQLNDYLLANKGKTVTFSTGTVIQEKRTSIAITGTRGNGSNIQETTEIGTGKCSITVSDDFINITSIRLRFNRNVTAFTDTSTTINYAMLVLGTEEISYKPYQEQKVDFPLLEGQKLYEGSYLASDGIHHKRTQVVLTGNEDWALTSTSNQIITKRFSCRISPPIMKMNSQENALCSHFANVNDATEDIESIYYSGLEGVTYIALRLNVNKATTLEQFKAYLAEQYSKGTPVTVEYELLEEEIIPYTEIQQEAWDKLQKLKLYKGQNTIFSMEGTIINLKYLEDTDEKVENQGNIYSKPIIRLEKTVFKEVEIAINGIRFKYDFEEDNYVEIDCEEMTVQYEGLDRNRRLVIDFEFPKLKEGNNDIIMYDGDCIIKCKRKDRWL